MEHQHVLYGDVPELGDPELDLPVLRDPDTAYYMRQKDGGLLIGPYEEDPVPWRDIPDDWASSSLPPSRDRIESLLDAATARESPRIHPQASRGARPGP